MMNINSVIEAIKKSDHIGITFHQSPDGDSLGSATALLQGLRALNKDAYILCKEPIPKTFSYLFYSEEITGDNSDVEPGTDIVIVLDCGDFKRINANISRGQDYKIINVDHHMSNEMYGDINYVDTNSAAVGEIIYLILEELQVKITKEIGISIYTSLLTDTSSFRHSNTTERTHEIAGEIINTGLNFTNIHRIIFEDKEFYKIKVIGEIISTMTLELSGKLVFMTITKNLLDKFNLENFDSSEVVHFGTMVSGAEVVALLKESKDGVKVSLRSKELLDVRLIAEGYNGGGHVRAAGFYYNGDINAIKDQLIKIIEKELR